MLLAHVYLYNFMMHNQNKIAKRELTKNKQYFSIEVPVRAELEFE